jgi:hypothetical protein
MNDENLVVPGPIKSGTFEYEGKNLTFYFKYGKQAGQANDVKRVCFNLSCAGELDPSHAELLVRLVGEKLAELGK